MSPKGGQNFIDLTGMRFGRLLVLERGPNNKAGEARWTCACDCGGRRVVRGYPLRRGASQSCGCLSKEINRAIQTTHGKRRTPEYEAWAGMTKRCYNPNNASFKYYGARGISVCDRWRTSFKNFLADMGDRPSAKHSLDRIDVNGNYEPSNCRWATVVEQANNKRNVIARRAAREARQ